MKNLEYFIPDDILKRYCVMTQVSQLGVGKAGKLGALFLLLEKNVKLNKTVIK